MCCLGKEHRVLNILLNLKILTLSVKMEVM